MKVCMIYYSNLNPLFQRDAKAFISRGDVVDVFCYALPHEKRTSPDRKLIIHRLMNRRFDEKGPLNYLLKISYFFLITAIKVSFLHIIKPFDLVYIVSPPDFMVFAAIIPRLLGAKIILNIHDIVPEFYMRKFSVKEKHIITKILKFVEKICCRFSDHVFTVTHIWKDKLISRTGILESKCTVLMNVPDNELIDRVVKKEKVGTTDFRLLYPGNLGEHFGVETLIRAMPIVKAKIPSIRLDIYGEGPQREFLQTLAKDLSVDQLISFNKYIPVEDLFLIMKQVDIGVVPTLDGVFAGEALSTKSLEFLAMGIPVIISRTEVSQYYYDDSMVMFFKQGDYDDLANCIIKLYRNVEKRQELVQNSKLFTEKYNWNNYRKTYYRTVDDLFKDSTNAVRRKKAHIQGNGKKKVIFELGHPAHVHLFKRVMWNLEHAGWDLKIVVRPREITEHLLKVYGFEYEVLNFYKDLVHKVYGIVTNDHKFYKIAKQFDPDLFVSTASPYSAQVSAILRKPFIAFTDTDLQKKDVLYLITYLMTLPFTDVLCTPLSFNFPLRLKAKKHIKYKGYHELAYLHSNCFKPDERILNQMHLGLNEKFIIMRIASWDAVHDVGHRGFKNIKEIIDFVEILQMHCKIFVTSEINIPELDRYKITIPPEKIHDLLAFATMYIGEGATMASEAGVLGVPWVFIYTKRLCYLDDQEKNYGLGYTVSDSKEALKIALNLLANPNLKKEWSVKREKLLNEKIDVSHFMTELIKGYPESLDKYRMSD